jgi:enhancing lycopene biosynthesis protein 2
MKVAVLLSGCGVYDGSEIHESVFSMLALAQNKLEYICIAPDIKHHHIINHTNGEELNEARNVVVESARISRGEIISVSKVNLNEISSLVIPGGFGAAKNLSNWAFSGADSEILTEVKNLIFHCVENKKPIVSLCISPVIIAKSLEGTNYRPKLTVGSVSEKSEYDIKEINDALSSLGSETEEKSLEEISIDNHLKIISAPCYMLDGKIDEIYNNTKMAIDKLSEMLSS